MFTDFSLLDYMTNSQLSSIVHDAQTEVNLIKKGTRDKSASSQFSYTPEDQISMINYQILQIMVNKIRATRFGKRVDMKLYTKRLNTLIRKKELKSDMVNIKKLKAK